MRTWFYNYRIFFLLLSLFLIFAGCSSHNKKVDEPDKFDKFNKWRTLAESSQPVTPIPEKETAQIESPQAEKIFTNITLPEQKEDLHDVKIQLPEIAVTMRMHGVPVPVLLKTLARIANINIIINESISGVANVDIKDVPWNQVFLGLLDTYGLIYEWSGSILRVITVDDLNMKKALLEAKQEYEQSKNEHSIVMLEIKEKQNQFEPLLTKIIKIHYADLNALQTNLEKYLETEKKNIESKSFIKGDAPKENVALRGSIMIDEFTNSLIIQAARADINKIIPIINELDKPIKQIRIEAHIVEANSDVAKELGIQWGGLGLAQSGVNNRFWVGGEMAPSGTSLKDSDGNNIAYNPNDGTIVNLPITPVDPVKGLALGILAESIGDFRLYAQLSALEEEGELNILSKPSITTMDHRKATIKSGQEVPFQTISSDGDIQIEFKEAVIKLEVVPHIITENIIRLEIVTHKDELDWGNTVNGNPTIITKNATTMVTLLNGQTTVIGGLNKEKFSDGEAGIPGLKDITGLGWLFKSIGHRKNMEELLIFITPYILEEQKAIDKPVKN